MELIKSYITKNPCYQNNVKRIDSRYRKFQDEGPKGGILHAVGCSQPAASVFIDLWNKPTEDDKAVHGIIDANSGVAYQLMPWNYRGWHAGGTANNTHIGVEMCESRYTKYIGGDKFKVLNQAKALADCKRAYDTAVELFAKLCKEFGWNPETDIMSHNEAGKKGIASGHTDPEHYWKGVGAPYTMKGFRSDVRAKLDEMNKPKITYRIQVGAFKNKKSAQAYLEEVRKKFPNAYMVEDRG